MTRATLVLDKNFESVASFHQLDVAVGVGGHLPESEHRVVFQSKVCFNLCAHVDERRFAGGILDDQK